MKTSAYSVAIRELENSRPSVLAYTPLNNEYIHNFTDGLDSIDCNTN